MRVTKVWTQSSALQPHLIIRLKIGWRDIQRRNRTAYSWLSLMRAYRSWRGTPSTYPLLPYFLWFILFKMIPMVAFNKIFFSLMRFSHSARV